MAHQGLVSSQLRSNSRGGGLLVQRLVRRPCGVGPNDVRGGLLDVADVLPLRRAGDVRGGRRELAVEVGS